MKYATMSSTTRRIPRLVGTSPDIAARLRRSHLSVTDVDLSRCRFAGARLLDEVRLEGRCLFDHPPQGVRVMRAWPPVWHWSNRQSLAEERTWRAATSKYAGWSQTRTSKPAEISPERLAGLYRQLRKAQEAPRTSPAPTDFSGEMEMRRHSTATPAAERAILGLYWLISGYGLRAVRALAALGILASNRHHGAGRLGRSRRHTISASGRHHHWQPRPDRRHPPNHGTSSAATGQQWTAQRTGTALQVTLDSVVFRTTDQPLTTAGIWTTTAARILGPVLLALALLAIRNRIKR